MKTENKKDPPAISSLKSNKYQCLLWAFLFILNIVATFSILFYIVQKTMGFRCLLNILFTKKKGFHEFQKSFPDFQYIDLYYLFLSMRRCVILALIATLLVNIFHLLITVVFPSLYIALNIYSNLILLVLPLTSFLWMVVDDLRKGGDINDISLVFAIFSLLLAIFGVFQFLYRRKFEHTSTSLIRGSSSLISEHPTLALFEIVHLFVLFVTNSMLIIGTKISTSFKEKVTFNPYIYLYTLFSYYWTLMTLYYLAYMITGGSTASCFYDKENGETKNIVSASVKRVITKQFGCAAKAGLLFPIIQVLKYILEIFNPKHYHLRHHHNDESNNPSFSFRQFSRQTLIYCAVFGCSYKDASNRLIKKNLNTRIRKLQGNSIISGCLISNFFFLLVAALGLAGVLYYYHSEKNPKPLPITMMITVTYMLSFFTILSSLIISTTDSLMLIYLEDPEVLKKHFPSLYDTLEQINVKYD